MSNQDVREETTCEWARISQVDWHCNTVHHTATQDSFKFTNIWEWKRVSTQKEKERDKYLFIGDHPWSSFWFSNKRHYLSMRVKESEHTKWKRAWQIFTHIHTCLYTYTCTYMIMYIFVHVDTHVHKIQIETVSGRRLHSLLLAVNWAVWEPTG